MRESIYNVEEGRKEGRRAGKRKIEEGGRWDGKRRRGMDTHMYTMYLFSQVNFQFLFLSCELVLEGSLHSLHQRLHRTEQ